MCATIKHFPWHIKDIFLMLDHVVTYPRYAYIIYMVCCKMGYKKNDQLQKLYPGYQWQNLYPGYQTNIIEGRSSILDISDSSYILDISGRSYILDIQVEKIVSPLPLQYTSCKRGDDQYTLQWCQVTLTCSPSLEQATSPQYTPASVRGWGVQLPSFS